MAKTAVHAKRWIRRTLWAGAVLSLGLLVAVVLWQSLRAVGDADGARVAGGVALGLLVCWLADFVALVVLLAIVSLSGNNGRSEKR